MAGITAGDEGLTIRAGLKDAGYDDYLYARRTQYDFVPFEIVLKRICAAQQSSPLVALRSISDQGE